MSHVAFWALQPVAVVEKVLVIYCNTAMYTLLQSKSPEIKIHLSKEWTISKCIGTKSGTYSLCNFLQININSK